VLGVDAAPVQVVAAERLRTKVTPDWTLDEASVSIQVGTPTIIGEVVSFPVTASATQVRAVDVAALLAEIRGKELPAARARLDDFGDAQVTLWPDWVTSIPTNPDRVKLSLGDPKPQPSPSP
jgi:hypothetical protein